MKFCELDKEGFEKWLEDRPAIIQELARKYPPNELFRLRTTGQRVAMVSIDESGTVRVAVPQEFNPKLLNVDINVFGIDPNDLEPLPESERGVIEAEKAEMSGETMIDRVRSGVFRQEYAATVEDSELRVRFMKAMMLMAKHAVELERFDRTVCTGPIMKDGIMPANPHEEGMIVRHAVERLKATMAEAREAGLSDDDLIAAEKALGRMTMRGILRIAGLPEHEFDRSSK